MANWLISLYLWDLPGVSADLVSPLIIRKSVALVPTDRIVSSKRPSACWRDATDAARTGAVRRTRLCPNTQSPRRQPPFHGTGDGVWPLLPPVTAADGPPAFSPDPTDRSPSSMRKRDKIKSKRGGGGDNPEGLKAAFQTAKLRSDTGGRPHVLGRITSRRATNSVRKATTFQLKGSRS